MKRKIRLFLIPLLLLATLFLVSACGNKTTGYDSNDAKGYTVSIKYDANGGVFIGTTAIMVDSFNISEMEKDANGMVNLKLLKPTDPSRGNWTPANGNKVLAGWYKERTESTDSNGNVFYTYSEEFNFDTEVVTIDPSKTYNSAEPVLTLYALWVDKYSVEFINIDTQEQVGVYEFNPYGEYNLNVPVWNEQTGKIDMNKFPTVSGMTFEAAYYDAAGTDPVTEKIIHDGEVKNGEVVNANKTIYVKYKEGNWYNIYTAKQLSSIGDSKGHYVLHADLDFAAENTYWPTAFIHNKFEGSIEGNGHTIKNVVVEQNRIDRDATGLFGSLENGAKLSNVTFENVTLKITKGARNPGTAFGLLAGKVAANVELENVAITSGTIEIDADGCYWATNDYAIGLVYGVNMGCADLANIDYSGITCVKTGEKVLTIVIDGSEVTITAG